MFMANDVICPRPWGTALDEFFFKHLGEVRTPSVKRCHDEEEELAWGRWYLSQIYKPDYENDLEQRVANFKHGAMHDAESVFNLCLLFFNRLWPLGEEITLLRFSALKRARGEVFGDLSRRTVGRMGSLMLTPVLPVDGFPDDPRFHSLYKALNLIHQYLAVPWYAVKGTGRGEPYEFHLHNLMQKVLLSEIDR